MLYLQSEYVRNMIEIKTPPNTSIRERERDKERKCERERKRDRESFFSCICIQITIVFRQFVIGRSLLAFLDNVPFKIENLINSKRKQLWSKFWSFRVDHLFR